MKIINQIAIKYLTYLVLNKRKLENKQATFQPPQGTRISNAPLEPPPKGGITHDVASQTIIVINIW